MNVRIEEQNLRFKISEDELAMLLSGRSLSVRVGFAGKALIATIDPENVGEVMETRLSLDDNEVHLNLLIPPSSVQKLSDMGRSRTGLQQEVNGASVSIQVDLRADSRKKAGE